MLRNLYSNHKTLIQQIISKATNKGDRIELIKYDTLTLDNKFNVIL